MKRILMLAAALSIAACANNNPPERQVAQFPNADDAADRRCIGQEPAALTDADLAAPDADAREDRWIQALLQWGRRCEAGMSRVCGFYRDLGWQLPPGYRCNIEIQPESER